MMRYSQQLKEIGDYLDERGHHALADQVTSIMTRMAQIWSTNTQQGMQLYDPLIAKDPNAWYRNPNNPYFKPQQLQQLMTQNSAIDISEFNHLKGTDFYKNYPYLASPQYQQDYYASVLPSQYYNWYQNRIPSDGYQPGYPSLYPWDGDYVESLQASPVNNPQFLKALNDSIKKKQVKR